MLHKLATCSPEKTILWVGAGISINSPTALPSGWDLTTFSISQTCGKKVTDRIITIWKQANQLINEGTANRRIDIIPRLESILDEIYNVQSRSINCRFNFMEGFKSYLTAPSNTNHLSIAQLFAQGAIIITTNFDFCIQSAYLNWVNPGDDLISQTIDNTTIYSSKSHAECGKIWHIHEIAEDISSLGATITKVKEGLSTAVQKQLDTLFTTRDLVLCLGYSFSDAFDINPYFESKQNQEFKDTHVVYINHSPSGKKENLPTVENLLKCFGTQTILHDDTAKIISNLSKTSPIPPSAFNWQDAFLAQTDLRDRALVRPFLTCRIANLLGIQITKLDSNAYAHALKFEDHYPHNAFHDTMAVVLRREGHHKEEKKHHLLKTDVFPDKKGDMLGYYYSRGNYTEAAKHAKPLSELFIEARDPTKELPWTTYTSMAVYCRPLVYKYIKKFPWKLIPPQEQQALESLIQLTNLLGYRPLKNVLYINQLATALRFHLLFKALLYGENDLAAQERILYLYGEGASVDGFISAYRDIAVKHYYLAFHANVKSNFKQAIKYAKKSLALSKLVGNIPGIKRIYPLLWAFRLLQWVKFLY